LKADEAYGGLPNRRTLEIMEERKKYLTAKNEKSDNKNNGAILREIRALERVINLIKLIQDKLSGDFSGGLIKETLEEKLIENDGAKGPEDNRDIQVLYSYEQAITKDSKLDISFIRYEHNSKEYILIALKKYKSELIKWVYQGKIKLTPSILEEILKKSKKMGMR
jgi:hypothetical protein